MEQVKIGKFIAEKRKEESLTQQQLADLIGISNKTISKWECGNGMPEVSLMLPLCDALHISVNELLCGEALGTSYQEKAEKNLIELMREKETEKVSGRKTWMLQGVALLCSFILWFLLFADSNVYQLGQAPTFMTSCYLVIGFLSIYAVIMIISYGIMKRNLFMLFAALSFASFACLLICFGYRTFWLMIPAIAGVLLCFALSLWCFLRTKKHQK